MTKPRRKKVRATAATQAAPKRLPSLFAQTDPAPKSKYVPKTKAQLIEENEKLQRQVQNRDVLLMFGALAAGFLVSQYGQQQKKPESTEAIVKVKS